MTTKYPASIDGYAEIRVVRDGIEEIIADDHNNLRSAVVSIERTLGVNPQGPFGTVVERLGDGYSNIEYHVSGGLPRHEDSVIVSPARIGVLPTSLETLPFSLSAGTLASQINRLLELLNDSLMYDGSGSTTLADGYAFIFSRVRSTVTELIDQLGGGTTGTTKVSGAGISGTNFSVSAGTLRSQLVALLGLVDDFGDTSGAGLVGSTGFTTTTGSRYTYSGTSTQDQIEESGNFLDEGAGFREQAFDAFVVSGMDVTQSGSGPDGDVAAGFIAANGRLIEYGSGTVTMTTSGTYYVYASISSGTVTISASTSNPMRAINPVVLLHKVTHAGSGWTSDLDLRRYGSFVNDKSHFTVGEKPTSGYEGYGYDFSSLDAAVETISVMQSSGEMIAPLKIILNSDITVSSSIEVDIDGLEIDGDGHTISCTTDIPIFEIESDYTNIHDLIINYSLSSSGSSGCLAKIGETNNITGPRISNCAMKSGSSSTPSPFFIRCGNSGGTTTISGMVLSNNMAKVEKGGLDLISTTPSQQVINEAVIDGNYFYQHEDNTQWASQSTPCIQANDRCVIDGNIIEGGFDTAISIEYNQSSLVSNNIIIGGRGSPSGAALALMDTGIALVTSSSGFSSRSVVSDNIVKGVVSYGINCQAGTGSAADVVVSGNYIDDLYDFIGSTNTLIGILCKGTQTFVIGNKIQNAGDHAIAEATNVIGNLIVNSTSLTSTVSAIECAGPGRGIVSDNSIVNVSGIGIDLQNNDGFLVNGNVLDGGSSSSYSIGNIANETIISSNIIMDYVSGGITSSSGNEITVIGNRIIDCSGPGIALSNSSGSIIANNWLECVASSGNWGIYGVGGNSIISGNYIANYGAGGYSVIELYNSTLSNIMISNNIIATSDSAVTEGILVLSNWTEVFVVDNIINDTGGTGIDFGNATDCVCAGNLLIGNSSSHTAINDFGTNCVIANNTINNYCVDSSDTAINATSSSTYLSIFGNYLYGCNGIGMDVNDGSYSQISDNFLYGGSNSWHGMYDIGGFSIVSNNSIIQYGGVANSRGFETGASGGKTAFIGNTICNPLSNLIRGFDLGSNIYYIVANNYIGDTSQTPIHMNGSSRSIISNNYMGCASTGTTDDNAIKSVGILSVISGNIIIQANYNAINISSGSYTVCVNNVMDSPSNAGISIDGNDNNIVTGNSIVNPGSYGILLESGSDNCVISNNYIYGSANASIYLESSASVGSDKVSIHGNYINSSSDVGIQVEYSTEANIKSNYILSPSSFGIYVLSLNSRSFIGDNFIYDSSSNGIGVSGSSNCLVANNYILEVSLSGIVMVGITDHISIIGNYIHTPGTSGISASGASSTSAEGLAISSNYLYNVDGGAAIEIEDADWSIISSNNIFNETTSVSSDNSIDIKSSNGVVINGNVIAALGSSDGTIEVDSSSNYALISNNVIRDASESAIIMSGDNYVISGNITSRTGTSSLPQIDASGTADGVIIGNNVADVFGVGTGIDGIDVSSTTDVLVVGNRSQGGATSGQSFIASFGSASDPVVIGNMSRGPTNPNSWGAFSVSSSENRHKA
jgi:parallel beta-helix repeat protein